MNTWLVLGIGNTLRRDDGLGPWLAEHVASWSLPQVTVRTVHQLFPETAAEIVDHDRVLFMDASCLERDARLIEVAPSAGPGTGAMPTAVRGHETTSPSRAHVTRSAAPWTHATAPGDVLALAAWLFGKVVPAWLLAVPGFDFDFGEGLSPAAQAAATESLGTLRELLEDRPCTKSA